MTGLGMAKGFDLAEYLPQVPAVDASAQIHPKAHVENSFIGARTKVWQFASVIRGAMLGVDCNIASCAIVDAAVLGNRCIVGHAASIHPGSHVGDDVFIGPAVTLCNDRWPRVPKDGFDIEWLLKGGVSVLVEDGASIGAGAVVLPGVVIGAGAMVAAGAVVDRNVPACHIFKRDGSICPIDPARTVRRMREAAA